MEERASTPEPRRRIAQPVRAIIAGAGVLLLATAAYHGAGHRRVVEAVAVLPADLAGMTGGLWLFFSWHLAVLAVAALLAAGFAVASMRPVLAFCGLIVAGDFLWVFVFAGWSLGAVLLMVAALGLLIGALFWRPR